MEQKHAKFERLLARCRELAPAPTAVAHPCDESSLRGAVKAAEGEAAMAAVVTAIRALEAAGELVLSPPDTEA
mgnify:CR=1 FL=1